ncbi:MAG TPA: hypothetical protein VG722_06885 [Tepidisphaeraceae bacterium]|nr:hypothetical protein [Tepidisphaeraceae bacterium]
MYRVVRPLLATLCVCFLSLALAGCGAEYRHDVKGITLNYQHGQYAAAADEANAAVHDAAKKDKRDQLIFLLEAGDADRLANRVPLSTQMFDKSYDLFSYYDQLAKTRISKEATSAFLNQAALDYEGTGYDRIMANVYTALNYLDQGDKDNARIEIHRIADSQRRNEQRWADKLKQSEQVAKENNADVSRAEQDPKVKQGTGELLSDFNTSEDQAALQNLSPKAVYDNPYAEYLQGLFYLYSTAPGDREVGRVALRNAAGMMQGNSYAVEDAHLSESAANGATLPPRTYVIFETGMAPKRVPVQIFIPVFLRNGANAIAIAFPCLKKVDLAERYLSISAGSHTYQTRMLADMDAIVAREFKNDLPIIITRAVISATVKAAANYAADEATRNSNGFVRIGTELSMLTYQAVTNEADVRTWRTLPKYVELASFPTPADGILNLSLPEGTPVPSVKVTPGKSTLVWVRCPSIMSSCVVRTFELN